MNRQSTILIAFILFYALVAGQSSEPDATSLKWFDSAVGIENTDLYNGTEYIEGYRSTREFKKFFIKSSFFNGSVHYDGQPYYDIPLKYDVHDDEIIAAVQGSSSESVLQLIKDKVKWFTLDGRHFDNIQDVYALEKDISGFHELVASNAVAFLYEKHRKKRWKRENKRVVYYEFSDKPGQFILKYSNAYFLMETKNDFYNLFPQFKNQLKEFYNGNEALRRAPKREQFRALLNKIGQLSL